MNRFVSKQISVCAGILCLSWVSFLVLGLSGCSSAPPIDNNLLRNTQLELVDWHISGFGIINSPVAWVRVANYNTVPINDIVLRYTTYDVEGHKLNEGTYTLEERVPPGVVKNFMELYLGLVDVQTERLSVQIASAREPE